jgi:hypothetical protein
MHIRSKCWYAALALALLFATGCSGAKKDPNAPEPVVEHFTLRSPGGFDELAIEGERVFGPNIEVTRYDDAYRGTVRQLFVDLRIRENLIEGTVANGRTELHIEKFEDGFSVQGLFGGRMGNITLRADRFEGKMGGRVFVLVKSEDPLVYRSAPGGGELGRGKTEFTFPASFNARPVEQQAALLALFLGR